MKNKNKNKRYKQCYTENERVFKKLSVWLYR
jgi:hypothetical protein